MIWENIKENEGWYKKSSEKMNDIWEMKVNENIWYIEKVYIEKMNEIFKILMKKFKNWMKIRIYNENEFYVL